mgnify:CR=1 FL=1
MLASEKRGGPLRQKVSRPAGNRQKKMIAPRFELRTLSEHQVLRIRDDQLHHATAWKAVPVLPNMYKHKRDCIFTPRNFQLRAFTVTAGRTKSRLYEITSSRESLAVLKLEKGATVVVHKPAHETGALTFCSLRCISSTAGGHNHISRVGPSLSRGSARPLPKSCPTSGPPKQGLTPPLGRGSGEQGLRKAYT